MIQTNLLAPGHADLVTHVVYDFYGERLATCSADQKIKLFHKSHDGTWILTTEWKAHDAPLLHLSFAHPLHGSLLASASHDRTVRIWEEPSSSSSASASASASSSSKDGRWIERGVLSGAKGSVRVVEFSPPSPSFGLRVVGLVAVLRCQPLYFAPFVSDLFSPLFVFPRSLAWPLFPLPLPPPSLPFSPLPSSSFSSVSSPFTARADPTQASISTDSYLRVHTSLDPALNDWSLTHDLHIASLGPPHGSDESVVDHPMNPAPASNLGNESSLGGWGLSFCKERWWGSLIACFSGVNPIVKVVSLDPTPRCLLFLTPPKDSSLSPLTSVCWSASCGRSYHLLASGSRDGTVRIWRVEPPESGDEVWKAECVADLGRGGARVVMVEWNATGTTLTTSDDDGIIRIYKPTYAKSWKLLGKMTAEEPVDQDGGQ
ncbi:nucleoporin SEH1, partial [Tremellales sp. Uapishka_1]